MYRNIGKCLGVMTGALTTCGAVVFLLDKSVRADGVTIKAPSYPWKFNRLFTSLDHSSIRRGWTVYKTVCITCHSLRFVTFKDLVDVCLTEDEAKSVASEFEIEDGPDEEGHFFKRPGKLFDKVPGPFPNEQAARAANNGAYPVDLSLIVNARANGPNYVFSLLTSWMDPPAGIVLMDGQSFNPYFPGGAISMPQMIQDGIVDYDDGTPASQSQMAKDIVEFLTWAANREWDTRKSWSIKVVGIMLILIPTFFHLYKQRWMAITSRKICYIPKQKRSMN